MSEADAKVVPLRVVAPRPERRPRAPFEELDRMIAEAGEAERVALALALATRLSELAARILDGAPVRTGRPADALGPSRMITVEEAAAIAGVTQRWIFDHTRGMRFRRDFSRKQVRIEEAGFRRWIESRQR